MLQFKNTKLDNIVSSISESGGRCLLVGGGVIDYHLGLPIKDWDIEVYGLSYDSLLTILQKFGTPNLVGKAFGVIKIKINKVEYDFSIPRRDSKIGIGHKGFTIDLVPDLEPIEAARRRDITINAMYLDLHTGEILDFFGGLTHLEEGRIKATDPATFIEDPLRVLRIMQLLPRKGKFVDPDTIALCRSMVDDFDTLPRERIFEEFRKLLLRADKPSLGLQFLVDCGWIEKFPELKAMIGCPQNPEYHPEGDVWVHTLIVVDNAAQLREHIPEKWQMAYMLGMLCHDMGKPETTDPVTLSSNKHEVIGQHIAYRFLRRMTNNSLLIDRVMTIVSTHMRPSALYKQNAGEGAWKRLHNIIPLQIIAWVTHADATGRRGRSINDIFPDHTLALKYGEEFGIDKIEPVLKGRHLIDSGLAPGSSFKPMLEAAYQHQLDTGCTDVEELLRIALNSDKKTK
jgi:tRNA nucleotidyltransferase (CCA-adding enzyme)